MYKEERFDKQGNLISYRFICSGRDPYTNKQRYFRKTWKIPKSLTSKKDIKYALLREEADFMQYVEDFSRGRITQEQRKYSLFKDYSNKWLEDIIKRDKESFTYYDRQRENIKVINDFFGPNMLLNQIQNVECKDFYNYLSNRTYDKVVVKVKKSVEDLVNSQGLTKTAVADKIGIARQTLKLAEEVGENVSLSTAESIAKYFKVPINNYFDIIREKCNYSLSTCRSLKTTLVMILNEAIRDEFISINYAERAYKKQFKEKDDKEVETYDSDEAKLFLKNAFNEPDLRKRAVYCLFLTTGCRKAEVCGLEWQDINFAKNTISIRRNSIYSMNDIRTKRPKTKKSKREITMPQSLKQVLLDYYKYWKELKKSHGDLWSNSKRLFLQKCGKPINPSTVGNWITNFENLIGLKHLPPKSLRHTACSLMLNELCVPLKVVSKRMGHADIKITNNVYSHANDAQEKRATEKYNDFLCENL